VLNGFNDPTALYTDCHAEVPPLLDRLLLRFIRLPPDWLIGDPVNGAVIIYTNEKILIG
jgi:hypothetical protein